MYEQALDLGHRATRLCVKIHLPQGRYSSQNDPRWSNEMDATVNVSANCLCCRTITWFNARTILYYSDTKCAEDFAIRDEPDPKSPAPALVIALTLLSKRDPKGGRA